MAPAVWKAKESRGDAEDAVVHDEADGPPDRPHEDQGIGIAHVVACEQRGPLIGDALLAFGGMR